MSNHPISNGKTLFDLFNMINPNCYQAFIIQCIIENKKEEALHYCDELSTAIEYYKWEASNKSSGYIDQLICESNLDKWKKIAIIYIISNNVDLCKKSIESQIKVEKDEHDKRLEEIKSTDIVKSLKEFYNMLGLNSNI